MEDEANGSRNERPPKRTHRRTSDLISYERSVEDLSTKGKETLMIVNQKRKKRPLNSIVGTTCTVYDNTCPAYSWLKNGWIVEERLMAHARLYRYYYDPLGQSYSSREEVEHICADIEKNRIVIIID